MGVTNQVSGVMPVTNQVSGVGPVTNQVSGLGPVTNQICGVEFEVGDLRVELKNVGGSNELGVAGQWHSISEMRTGYVETSTPKPFGP